MPEQVANDEGDRRTGRAPGDDDDAAADFGGGAVEAVAAAAAHTVVVFASRASPDGNDGRDVAADADAAVGAGGGGGRGRATPAVDAVQIGRSGRMSFLR